MAINTVDDIAAGLSAAQVRNYMKVLAAPKAAGSLVSSWLASGLPGAGSAAPAYTAGSGYTCSSATTGAIQYVNGAVKNWLAKMTANSSQPGTLILVDRLWACSGMGFAAGTYAVTTPGALPARITDSGVGVEAYVEQYVVAGAASGTLTLNYLNTAAAAKSGVIAAVVSAPSASQLQPIPWQTGDVGISQVTSAVTSATWTSGTFGITLLKRIAEIPLASIGVSGVIDWALAGLPTIPADACLQLIYIGSNTTAATVLGNVTIIDK